MSDISINSFIIETEHELSDLAKKLLQMAGNKRIWLFYGEMGSGKTTLIKALCHQLHVTDAMSSPTFSIVNEYHAQNGKIFHFDLYRIKSEQELIDIGFDEYLDSRNYCFIEWPEKAPLMLQGIPTADIYIEAESEKRRFRFIT